MLCIVPSTDKKKGKYIYNNTKLGNYVVNISFFLSQLMRMARKPVRGMYINGMLSVPRLVGQKTHTQYSVCFLYKLDGSLNSLATTHRYPDHIIDYDMLGCDCIL